MAASKVLFCRAIVANQRSFKAKDEIVWELTEIRIGTPGGFGTVILD